MAEEIFFSCVIRSEREDERGLPKGCFINLDFFEKGNQNAGGLIHLPMKDISAHAKLFAQRGVRARPGLYVTFGSKLHPLLLSAPLSLYIFICMEIKSTSLFGLIAGNLKSNFVQGPVIVHSGVKQRHQRKVEIDSQGSGGR